MGKTISIFITFALLTGFFTALTALIPPQITTSITNSITYFLSFLNYLTPVFNIITLFTIIKIMANFYMAVVIFKGVHFILHLFNVA